MMGMRMPWQQGDYIQTFICGFIYFIFHLHAPRASVGVFCSRLRGGSVFEPNSVFSEQSARERPRPILNKLLDFFKGSYVHVSAARCRLFRGNVEQVRVCSLA